jgi:hypothetical protein
MIAAGGLRPFGLLRDHPGSKRGGAVMRRLDLYDLLLRGDTSDDAKLLSGDVIFIPPVSCDRRASMAKCIAPPSTN